MVIVKWVKIDGNKEIKKMASSERQIYKYKVVGK